MLKRRQGRRAARKSEIEREREREGRVDEWKSEWGERERKGEDESRGRSRMVEVAAREGESPRTASDGFELGELRAQKRHPSRPLRAFDGTPPPSP